MSAGTAPLPGMGDERIEEIRDAALKYVDLRDQRMGTLKLELEAKTDLLDVMHSHNLKRYHDSEAELLVEIEAKSEEKLKVRLGKESAKAEDEDEGEDEDEPIAKRTMKPRKRGKPNAGVPREDR